MTRDVFAKRPDRTRPKRRSVWRCNARRARGWRRPQDVADWLAAGALAAVVALAMTSAWIFGGLALSPGWQAAAELAAGYAGPKEQEAP